jgi:hypothetical protein
MTATQFQRSLQAKRHNIPLGLPDRQRGALSATVSHSSASPWWQVQGVGKAIRVGDGQGFESFFGAGPDAAIVVSPDIFELGLCV